MLPLTFGPFSKYNPSTPKRGLSLTELSTLRNVQIVEGSAELFPGWSAALGGGTSQALRILHMEEHRSVSGTRYLCIHTPTKFLVWNGVSLTDLTKVGDYDASTNFWSSCSFGDLYIFSNGLDNTQSWDSSTPATPAGDATNAPKAKIFISFGSYVIAANIVNPADSAAGKLMKWCTAGDPTNWTTGDSGSLYVYEAEGDINVVQPITRDALTIYKDLSTHTVALQSFPFTFVATSMIHGIGVTARRGVARFRNLHVCLTNAGVQYWDGVNYTPADNDVKWDILNYHPSPYTVNSIVYYLPMRGQVWVLLAGISGYCERAFVLDVGTSGWNFLDELQISSVCLQMSPTITRTWDNIEGTWDEQTLTWDTMYSATDEAFYVAYYNGSVHRVCYSVKGSLVYLRDGTTYIGCMETGVVNPAALLFEKPFNLCELTQISVGVGRGSPQVYVGVTQTGVGETDVSWNGPYTPDASGNIYVTITGRFFLFRIQGTEAFVVSQITPYFVLRGVC